MRAYLINPKDRTIATCDVASGSDDNLEAMYKFLDCSTVEKIELSPRIDLWMDEEGHLTPGLPIFYFGTLAMPLAGRGLILGHDGEGHSVAVDFPVDIILGAIRWTELISSGQFTPVRTDGENIYGGEPMPTIRAGDAFLIWSNEHRRWWAPGSSGYVDTLREAGRYSRQHALQICRDAQGGWNGKAPPPEVPVRELDALAAGLAGRIFAAAG